MTEQMQIDGGKLIDALTNEIGILSVQVVTNQLHIKNLNEKIEIKEIEIDRLTKHIMNLDKDLKEVREELANYRSTPTKILSSKKK